MLACAAAVPFLQALGFVEIIDLDATNNTNSSVLRIDEGAVDNAAMTAALDEITSTLTQLDDGNTQNKKPRMTTSSSSFSTTSTNKSNTTYSQVEGKLSEKQKARRLMEEKQQKERELARQQRKQNVALLKQDKYVRQNDDNWKSGVSAACAKSGDSISTFRDKFGE